MSTIRLDKLISNLGYASRKEAAILVKRGSIELRGEKINKSDQAIALADVKSGALTIDGEAFDPPTPFTIMLNKPAGYICSHDEKGKLVYDLLPPRWQLRSPALSCAGRLDKDSTGQVILTDDGDLLHRIIHPKSHAVKHYKVTLHNSLRGDEAALFSTGTFLMEKDTKPLKPAVWQANSATSGTMQLHEGRYHQIRRMFETIGNHVVALHRFKTGGLELGGLTEEEYRVLDEAEIALLFSGVLST